MTLTHPTWFNVVSSEHSCHSEPLLPLCLFTRVAKNLIIKEQILRVAQDDSVGDEIATPLRFKDRVRFRDAIFKEHDDPHYSQNYLTFYDS